MTFKNVTDLLAEIWQRESQRATEYVQGAMLASLPMFIGGLFTRHHTGLWVCSVIVFVGGACILEDMGE